MKTVCFKRGINGPLLSVTGEYFPGNPAVFQLVSIHRDNEDITNDLAPELIEDLVQVALGCLEMDEPEDDSQPRTLH